MRCNSGDQFSYQNPGTSDDTPEGPDYNLKRDFDILQQLGLAPGCILPGRVLLKRMLHMLPSAAGICAFGSVTADAWRGCSKAGNEYYEKGRAKGLGAIIPPRDKGEMARDKQSTLKEMYETGEIKLRPHLLMCAVALHGQGARPPYEEDNIPEMIQAILEAPATPITLVQGADRMMCGPCPHEVADRSACVTGTYATGGLYNELKDLNVLQILGLTYGTTMKAKELYDLLFERIPSVRGVCALARDIPDSSLWRDTCGKEATPCTDYDKGRKMLMAEFAEM